MKHDEQFNQKDNVKLSDSSIDSLADVAVRLVIQGAKQYLDAHNLKIVSEDAFRECCKSWTKIKLPEALNDAKEAIECNMGDVATATFAATMMQAGIEAAKECSIAPIPA